ncbi:MAG: hypothetical protein KA254_03475, partial [Rhodoferax sp.]|nr:hypothetical protein [Rhodoferax sp.]
MAATDSANGQGPHTCCGGHCSPAGVPVPVVRIQKKVDAACVQTPIRILQMDCPTEEALLRNKLGGMAGVAGMEFNLIQRVLTVTHDPAALDPILRAIRSLGFAPELATAASAPGAPASDPARPWWPLALSALAALASEVAHWVGLPVWVSAVLATAAVLLSGTATYCKGWIAIRTGNLNINALMSIAVTGAL